MGVTMKIELLVAAAVVIALPLAAQAQKKPTRADAEKVVKLISADKNKVKVYCDMTRLGEQAAAAEEKKDTKKAEELGMKMDDMSKQLGPEYVALMDSMQNLNENEAESVGMVLEGLDKLCTK